MAIVKNINITKFTKLSTQDILSSHYGIDADNLALSTYMSSKLNINDLSNAYECSFTNNENVVSGQWRFLKPAYVPDVTSTTKDYNLINLKYMNDISSYLSSQIHDLSTYIFDPNDPHVPSFPGQIIVSYEGNVNKINHQYGGQWQAFGVGRFILGAKSTENATGANLIGGQEKVKLTVRQAHTPVHKHNNSGFSTSGSGSGKNLVITYVSSYKVSGHTNRTHSTSTSAPFEVPYFGFTDSTTKSISGTTSKTSNSAAAEFDNRPHYLSLYFWRRIS